MNLTTLAEHEIINEVLMSYRNPYWVKSNRGESAFVAQFDEDDAPLIINLCIDVDGDLLTSAACAPLLQDILDLLCIQVPTSKKIPCSRICRSRLRRALHVVDHLLLKANDLSLGKLGFSGLSSGNITDILLSASESSNSMMSLYGWTDRLSKYLKAEAKKLKSAEINAIYAKHPLLEAIPIPQDEWRIKLTTKQLRAARAVLMKKNLYKRDRQRRFEFEYDSQAITRIVYKDTLFGVEASKGFPLFQELCIGSDVLHRELPPVPVGTMRDDQRCSVLSIREYCNVLLASEPLAHLNLGIPLLSIEVARDVEALELELKKLGRTAAVPPPHIAAILRKAIPFFVDHCEHILRSMAAVIRFASLQGVRPESLDLSGQLTDLLLPETAAFGIRAWSVGQGSDKSPTRLDGPAYANRLRDGTCLLQMSQVAFGVMATLVGAMTFGRQGELGDIRITDVDTKNWWVKRRIGKTGFEGYRLDGTFPVPKVVVDIYLLLRRFLDQCGHTDVDMPLFSLPTSWGTVDSSACRVYAAVDTFLDFIDGPCDSEGRRYYLRQHQLRGALPTLFLYSSDSPDVDALRWALGHTTDQEIWTYLSQVTPGAVLQSAKANVVAHLVKHRGAGSNELARAVVEQLGVESIDVFTTEELAGYLEEQMHDGKVSVSPVFPTDTRQSPVRVGLILRRK